MTPVRIFVFLLAMFVAMFGWAAANYTYYRFFEPPWLSYTQLPLKVMTPSVKPGERVLLTVVRCNSDMRTRTYTLSHLLVPTDKRMRVVVLDATSAQISPGCTEGISPVNLVPVGTPAGEYHVEGISEVAGTITTFLVGWRSESFKVVQ